jgi:hypothetical protein
MGKISFEGVLILAAMVVTCVLVYSVNLKKFNRKFGGPSPSESTSEVKTNQQLIAGNNRKMLIIAVAVAAIIGAIIFVTR